MMKYDLLIIGAGPAGLTAGIYSARFKINHLVIGEEIGGQMSLAYKIGNYPSESEIQGTLLVQKIEKAAKDNGVKIKIGKVEEIKKEKNIFSVLLEGGEEIKTKAIILSSGLKRKKLGLSREEELRGKGIHYCFICDGVFYQDKIVAMVGGGNSALTGSLYLAEIAKEVFLICIEKDKNELLAEPIWIDKAISHPKIKVFWETRIAEFLGNNFLKGAIIENLKNKEKEEIRVDGVFIEIGGKANLPKMDFKLKLTEDGLVEIDMDQSTNIRGFFASGDLTNGSNKVKQIITAMSEGAVAARSAFLYLKSTR